MARPVTRADWYKGLERSGQLERMRTDFRECMRRGMSRTKAMTLMRERYKVNAPPPPPLYKDEPPVPERKVTKPRPKKRKRLTGDEEREIVREFLTHKESTIKEDYAWVYRNLAVPRVDPREAPSSGAWGLLRWALKNKEKFYSTVAAVAREQGKAGERLKGEEKRQYELIDDAIREFSPDRALAELGLASAHSAKVVQQQAAAS